MFRGRVHGHGEDIVGVNEGAVSEEDDGEEEEEVVFVVGGYFFWCSVDRVFAILVKSRDDACPISVDDGLLSSLPSKRTASSGTCRFPSCACKKAAMLIDEENKHRIGNSRI